MFRTAALAAWTLASVGCAHSPRSANSEGVAVAQSLCSGDGSIRVTSGAHGSQIFCGLEEMVGTHIPKCVCRSDASDGDREIAREAVRSTEQSKQVSRGN